MTAENQRWLQDLKDGREEALKRLFSEFSAPLGRYLTGMVKHAAVAEDLVQEALLKFLSSLDTFRGEASVKSYLYRIATNLALNHLASAAHRRETFPEELPEGGTGGPSPQESAAREETTREIRSAVASLPPRQRAVVILRTWQELTFREIAQALEMAEGTAKATYFYALRNLRTSLGGIHES